MRTGEDKNARARAHNVRHPFAGQAHRGAGNKTQHNEFIWPSDDNNQTLAPLSDWPRGAASGQTGASRRVARMRRAIGSAPGAARLDGRVSMARECHPSGVRRAE